MIIDTLKEELPKFTPVVQDFLKTILLKKVEVSVTSSEAGTADTASESLKKTPVLVKTSDGELGVDLIIGFDESWIAQLATAMLEIEETKLNEVTRDLMKEFASQLIGAVQTTLKEKFGITYDAEPVEIIKPASISKALQKEQYFVANLTVSGKFDIEGDEKPELGLIVAFSIHDEASAEINSDDTQSKGDTKAKKSGSAEKKAEKLPEENKSGSGDEPLTAQKVEFDDLSSVTGENSDIEVRNLELLRDVRIRISVELGQRELPLGEILHLVRGSVIELDKLASEPVSVHANGRTIAKGEVVVIDDHFGVRITNLISTKERIEVLQ
ncbi:MAG TPA: flagellar motor switch protein FliN [Balneolales bacterium]|nr:flagellar motor switch protein FliN [Balneolales bacterium]